MKSKILKENKYKFEEQFIFDGLKTNKGGTPRFDFVIFDDDYKINCIIEFDGIHHFLPIAKFGGIKRLKDQNEIDNFKNKYCLDNRIKIIRIPYTEFDKINSEYLKGLIGF